MEKPIVIRRELMKKAFQQGDEGALHDFLLILNQGEGGVVWVQPERSWQERERRIFDPEVRPVFFSDL